MTPRDKLLAARILAVQNRPYFATALYALIPRECEPVGTMGVDKWWRLYYNCAFVESHTVEELAAVLYHEIGHLLREHNARCESNGFEHEKWNIAGDLEINDDLQDEKINLPAGALYPNLFRFPNGLLAEEYYGKLPAPIRIPGGGMGRGLPGSKPGSDPGSGRGSGSGSQPGSGQGGANPGKGSCGSAAHGKRESWELGDPSNQSPGIAKGEADAIRGETARKIVEHASTNRGTVPAGWKRWAEVRLQPKVSWRKELAAAVRMAVAYASGAVDYSYKRPSRRQSALPKVVLPTLIRPIPSISVVIDTSGSMADDQIAQALAEVRGVLEATGSREGVRVLSCDAAVHTAKRVFRAEQVELIGGGGTDMVAGISVAAAQKPTPNVIIVLSDGYTPWPDQPPPATRVIVCLVGNGTSPAWAKTIKVEVETNGH